MPELPEVETVRREIEPRVVGQEIKEAWSEDHPRFQKGTEAEGRVIEAVRRRGKYLLLLLDDGNELIIHLGMTGVLRLLQAGESESQKHVRCRWRLLNGEALELSDPRKFGRVGIVKEGEYSEEGLLGKLGPEPFSEEFTPSHLHKELNRSRTTVKADLLTQHIVAGAGNIYVDEACHAAGVHPGARQVSEEEAERLHAGLLAALRSGLERRGTTLRDYRTSTGSMGSNQDALRCYGRAGEKCLTCESVLVSSRVAGRGTTHCPTCQEQPQATARDGASRTSRGRRKQSPE